VEAQNVAGRIGAGALGYVLAVEDGELEAATERAHENHPGLADASPPFRPQG
jgi:hypothetical protein